MYIYLFLCYLLLYNKLPPNLAALNSSDNNKNKQKNPTFIISYNFYGSEIQKQLTWVVLALVKVTMLS